MVFTFPLCGVGHYLQFVSLEMLLFFPLLFLNSL